VPSPFVPRTHDVHRTRPWAQYACVSRRLRTLAVDLVARAELPSPPRVVDYGCADLPYRDLFPPDAPYLGVDLPGNPAATVALAPDGTVPLGDGTADLVLSTQVLEHVDDPARYLAECRRLLVPGGALVLTTHGLMYLHRDPQDLWRWTCDGLRRIVADAGLEVVELRGVLGLAPAALQLLQDESRGRVPRVLRSAYQLLFQLAIGGIDRCYSDRRRNDNALVFGVLARRPVAG
jgi:SAM-dependent methyltransferase